ncbi:MAG TPA: low-complexity tail membrane protein [Cyanobacteria bacterium UBA11049]|nr:low-complexity tail membrane protein [Cyanobacteria bacterium UBA11049]
MRSFRSEPILWIHLAGLATLPIFLEICWLGLAVGQGVLPVWLEFILIVAIGVVPVLWVQLQRPFSIFAVVGIAQKPEQLDEQQRKILSLINTPANQVLAVLVAIFLIAVLWQLYQFAPVAATVVPFPTAWRWVGLVIAALAFLASNVFLQIPVSVARIFVTSETKFAATKAYPLERIPLDFTIVGLQVNQILPQLD